MSRIEVFTAAGVPVVLRHPEPVAAAPLIVLWHGFGAPASPEALAATFPLDDVHACKAYLGLPLLGTRMPEGGLGELARRQRDDYLLQLLAPVVDTAIQELPAVLGALADRVNLRAHEGIGLFGFSVGAAAALLAVAEHVVPITAAVAFNGPTSAGAAVRGMEHSLGTPYRWTDASQTAAKRLDFVARAADLARGAVPPALLLLHGGADEYFPAADTQELFAALRPSYERAGFPERLALKVLPWLGHQIGPAQAGPVQFSVADWFRRHLATT